MLRKEIGKEKLYIVSRLPKLHGCGLVSSALERRFREGKLHYLIR